MPEDKDEVLVIEEPDYTAFDELVEAVEVFGADWDRDHPPADEDDGDDE